MTLRALLLSACALATPTAAAADPADDLAGALLEVRTRYETVTQDSLPETAHALTVRPRLGWRTERRHGLQALVEGEAVVVLDQRFSAPLSPDPARPAVGDGEALELNRAQLSFTGLPETEVVLGRQRLILDDGRFVGNSGWRQNEQTFDAVRLTTSAIRGVDLSVFHAEAARRFPGEDHPDGVWDGRIQAVEAAADTPVGRLVGMFLRADLDGRPGQSSDTWSLGLAGERAFGDGLTASWRLGVAEQSEVGNAAVGFDLSHWRVIAGLRGERWAAQVGREWLEGDGTRAFQTPLGSNHGFLGWSDVIGATPAFGLTDDFARGQATLAGAVGDRPLRLSFEAHRFQDGDADFAVGREFDAAASLPLGQGWTVEAKAARFESERPEFADATKVWLTLEYRY